MTPTKEMTAMAERIADEQVFTRSLSHWGIAYKAALTAIMEEREPRPVSEAPNDGYFLAPNINGDWLRVKRYENPFGNQDTVIHVGSGKWWSPSHWMPTPSATGSI